MVLTFKSLSGLLHALTLRAVTGNTVDGFLACYFPVHRRYLIKPQGKIRSAVWTELGGDESMLRITLDSYSGEVLSRTKMEVKIQ